MQDSIEQITGYFREIWRHRWIAMIVVWVVALGGWVWVSAIPNQYEASTRVYIDTDSVLRPLLKGLAVETDVEQRLQLMTRTLLSRPNLEKLTRMTDMDLKVTTPLEKEGLLLGLKNNIQVNSVKEGRSRDASNFYLISYKHNNRNTAKLVVQSLLNILVESSLGDTREDSASAREFLDKQIKEYEIKLRTSEDRLGAFKRENLGFLPNNEGGFFNSLKNIQEKYDSALLELQESKNRRDTLSRQLEEFRATGVAPVETIQVVKSPLQERLQMLSTRLDDMLLRFTDQHPDVRELRIQVEALKTQVNAEEESRDKLQEADRLESNPLYQQLRISLGQEESNIGAIEVRVHEYGLRIDKLKKEIQKLQQVELELSRLDRGYASNKINYAQLVTRRDSAELAGQAEQTGNSIQFRVIDPPFVPEKPTAPDRLLLSSLVLLVAIGAGTGLAFLISQNNPTFFSRKLLQETTGVAVFGSVTKVYSGKELMQQRIKHASYMLAGILLCVMFAGVVFVQQHESNYLDNLRLIAGHWI